MRKFGEWNSARLILESGRLGVAINDAPNTWLPLRLNDEQKLGFQSGIKGALVDEIVIRGTSGQALFRESFANAHIRGKMRMAILVCHCQQPAFG